MGILRSLGSIIFLVALLILMPAVFSELTKTLVVFLESSQEALAAAGSIASRAGYLAAPH